MYCSNCGEKFHKKPNYCTHCGYDLRQVNEEEEMEAKVEEVVVESEKKEEVAPVEVGKTEAVPVHVVEVVPEVAPVEVGKTEAVPVHVVEVVPEETPVEEPREKKSETVESVPLEKSFFKYNPEKTELTKGDHILKNLTYILSSSIVIALIIFYFAMPSPSRVFDLRVGSDYAITDDGYKLVGSDSNVLKNDGNFVYRFASNQTFGENNYDVILEKVVDQEFQVILNENVKISPKNYGHFQEVLIKEAGDYRLTITMGGNLVGVDHFSIR